MITFLLKKIIPISTLVIIVLTLSACSSMVTSSANKLAGNLSQTILNSDDPKTVADGAPAYLLLMDSFLLDSPDNPALLKSAATIYSAYAGVFVSDPERAARMANKALSYAEQLLCLEKKELCHIRESNFKNFSQQVSEVRITNYQSWAVFGTIWAGWIRANSGSMSAIAEIPKVTLIMERIIQLDESWQNGSAHLYLGVLKTLIPPALGGKPEQGQEHFKRAIELSENKSLMVKVLYAEKYAKLVFNQTLHDRLLTEVIGSDPYQKDLTLMNIIAQKKAQKLLESSAEYF